MSKPYELPGNFVTDDATRRYWLSVDKTEDCWARKGAIARDGYGVLRSNYRRIGAHRYAWLMEHGTIPEGMIVCHRCDNKKCVRLSHLFLGTPADNTRDMIYKCRNCHGTRHHASRLNEFKVRELHGLFMIGWTDKQLAKRYGIDASSARAARLGMTWRHLGLTPITRPCNAKKESICTGQ